MTIRASPLSYPDLYTETVVLITTNRNVNGPVFIPSDTYVVPLEASHSVGELVVTLEAIDRDPQVQEQYS